MELADRDATEQAFAARVARLSGELRAKLIDLLGNPPDPSRVPDSFWTEAEDEMKRELAIVLLLIWGASARQHGLPLPLLNPAGDRYVALRSEATAAQFSANSRARLQSLIASPAAPQTAEGLAAGTFNPSRAEGLATTETTAATSAGSEAAKVQTVGIQELDTWFTVGDEGVCPICQPLHRALRSEWMAEFPLGPPAHPNCRCWIEYADEKTGVFANA